MFINRDWDLEEQEDFNKRVSPKMLSYDWATPVWHEGIMYGWKIKPMYEQEKLTQNALYTQIRKTVTTNLDAILG